MKVHESACPFCGAARGGTERTVRSLSIRGISRGRWLTLGTTALALAGCDAANGDEFFECAVHIEAGAISVSYCQRWAQYCSAQGTCVTLSEAGSCAVVSGSNACMCNEDAGAVTQRCSTSGFFTCSAGPDASVVYCEKGTEYCSQQGTCTLIADGGPCAYNNGGSQCMCTEDAGAMWQQCTSHSGCYGAPPARPERLTVA